MRVQVKLFATLAARRPGVEAGAPFEVQLPTGATVADLVAHLELPPNEVRLVFVGGRARPSAWPLHPGDEVGIFPPVGGG
ncbi:MAG: MoaD/ThiS family protein [Chloroflexi bacterium]|nr:MoaD/ThiS family protein [Chloroflexota bacterium]